MFPQAMTKPVAGKVRRQGASHFTTVILPVTRAVETDARFDALGGVLIISLSVTVIFWMRLMLAN
jgi:hypothetical protein